MTEALADQRIRERALQPAGSFIVQAPAGSGKTELLTQRYLRLLAGVEIPEEIVAITFTRKAAGEMRSRIVNALALASHSEPPEEAHARRTWELARAVLERDQQQGWQLLAHPARLRIQTIDSLNAELTRQMPVLSGFGAQPGIAERAQPLYEEAARRTLMLLEQGDPEQSGLIATLLRHLDNDIPRVMQLLAEMLARRDQWLRHTGAGGNIGGREQLERAFRHEIERQLQYAHDAFPARFRQELVDLAAHAGRFLQAQGKSSPIVACSELQSLPEVSVAALPAWQGLVELLLTKNGSWRSAVDVRIGFEAKSDEKTRMQELLQRLSADAALPAVLQRVRTLPDSHFDANQWQMLDALLNLLPLSVAQLKVLFSERGEVDYAEVALSALQALGTADTPSELALSLDYRIRHLLVDEFQDTSFNQFLLLERLTSGWQAGDGRTLFVVGDPMQSIYRFREAEVGLFLRAQQSGIGGVLLTPLTLQTNFRSQRALVEWVNDCFSQIFPAQADVASGAVNYSASVAFKNAAQAPAVQVHPAFERDSELEASRVVELIREAHRLQQKVAVLVRGRNHLVSLVPRLRREGLRFRAMELEQLGERPVVHDLVALTRALIYPADRTSWLALLRAPWCGLSLADLYALTTTDPRKLLAAMLDGPDALTALSDEGQQRLARVRTVMHDATTGRRRGSLREQVERTWWQLAGPATVGGLEDLADAEAYLNLLETLDQGGTLSSITELDTALAQLFAQPDPQADDSLQLMTMHKAKGLEFDVVIVPGLGAGSGRSQRPLLTHLERTRPQGVPDLLLAPLNARGRDKDPLYELVFSLRREQEQFEQQRLMYVAATRARQQLHLLGHAGFRERDSTRELLPPSRNSLLATLWPMLEPAYRTALSEYEPAEQSGTAAALAAVIRRVPLDWKPPLPPADLVWVGGERLAAEPDSKLEFEWAGETLRHIGTVVHRLLQQIANEGPEHWDDARLQARRMLIESWLHQAGVPVQESHAATDTVLEAVSHTLADATGRMILAARGPEARTEYALSRFEDGRLVSGVIDRTFVDNDGVRWIVDYKTSRHEGGNLTAFLAREADRYRGQLARYAEFMQLREDRLQKLGLYFPLLGRFHPVELQNQDDA